MFKGLDVAHPAPGELKPSVASLVASTNPEITKFTSFIHLQRPHQEVIGEDSLYKMLKVLIAIFF